jgi:hypothetical protein
MKQRRLTFLLLLVVIASALLAGIVLVKSAAAQTGDGFDLSWNVIGGGGGKSTGSGFTVEGTIGQPVVGLSSDAEYTLQHGFWVTMQDIIRMFLPLVEKE